MQHAQAAFPPSMEMAQEGNERNGKMEKWKMESGRKEGE